MLSAAPVDDVFVIGGMGLSTVVAAQGLLGNGTSGAGQALTVAAGPSAGVKGGNFQINADGSFTYAPGSSF
ncbi:MAG TPA: Ig-like domain-containing protein, partial [Pirellulales bacterium]|nr:Ig-like domain-containing protein [Pirellulales bacterium]